VKNYLQIGRGSTYEIICNKRHFHKVCVPKKLTERHRRKRLDILNRLEPVPEEDDVFLRRIVTGDEMWTHHYNLEIKQQSTK
jgi:hypothetical protein